MCFCFRWYLYFTRQVSTARALRINNQINSTEAIEWKATKKTWYLMGFHICHLPDYISISHFHIFFICHIFYTKYFQSYNFLRWCILLTKIHFFLCVTSLIHIIVISFCFHTKWFLAPFSIHVCFQTYLVHAVVSKIKQDCSIEITQNLFDHHFHF